MVIDTPRAGAKGNLEQRMAVQQDNDGNQDAKREGMMGQRLVRFVERMRSGQFVLVVYKFLLLETV